MVLQQLKALHAKDLFNEMICLVLEIIEITLPRLMGVTNYND